MMAVGSTAPAMAQNYPNHAVRIVAPEAGGGGDITARLIAQRLSGPLGQQVIVDNRQVVVSIETAAKALPDGYTLLLSASMWILPFFQKEVSWDPVRDFSPVISLVSVPSLLIVHPSLPVKSVRDLIAVARAHPGELNYATSATGTANHLAAELFKSMAGVNIVRINYKGSSPALNDLIAGQVQLIFTTAATVAPQLKSGRLRALAVTSAKRSALTPELPTMAASGLPGYEWTTINGLFAPAGTPAVITTRLNREISRILENPDVKERFLNSGAETAGGSPEELGARIRLEMTRIAKLVREAHINAS
jgi:tripartite-type tricarboxylate transporter receptor subunit TctC